jgi:hypothetical protein
MFTKLIICEAPNGLAQRQRRDRRDSSHYRAISGKPTPVSSGRAAVRLEPVLAGFLITEFYITLICLKHKMAERIFVKVVSYKSKKECPFGETIACDKSK